MHNVVLPLQKSRKMTWSVTLVLPLASLSLPFQVIYTEEAMLVCPSILELQSSSLNR